MDDIVLETIIKEIGLEKPAKPVINWKACCKSCFMWLFGGILAILPNVLHFILLPVDSLTSVAFFGNAGIIYTSITMEVIALCANMQYVGALLVAGNILIIVIGTMLYALLECGVIIPMLNENGLYKFNIALLLLVLIIGIIMFLWANYKNGGKGL